MNEEDYEYEPDYCDICFDEITSSHYHCGNCGQESGMMGHYSGLKGEFTCKFVHEQEWNPNYEEEERAKIKGIRFNKRRRT